MPEAKVTGLEVLPVSPITLACPFCKAEPGRDCATSAGGFPVIHIQRIKAAGRKDAAREGAARKHATPKT